MRTAVLLRNVVRETEDVFLIGVVPLKRAFDPCSVLIHVHVNDGVVRRRLVAVQVFDKGRNSALVFEDVFPRLVAFIAQNNANTRIQERQLA